MKTCTAWPPTWASVCWAQFEEGSFSDEFEGGTYAKMARGEMVRFIAENNIENPVEIQKFDRLGYSFRFDLSSDSEYVFERKIK